MLAGVSIGWLLGISVSPVLAGTLSVIVGAMVSCTTAGLALKKDDSPASSYFAITLMALLGVGAMLGAMLGIYFRTFNLLSPSFESQMQRLKRAGIKKEIYEQALMSIYFNSPGDTGSLPKDEKKAVEGSSALSTTLMAGPGSPFCLKLAAEPSADAARVRGWIQGSDDVQLQQLESKCKDDALLIRLSKEVACSQP